MEDHQFKILSIDGGGIRGVYPAHILSCISERLGIEPAKYFDMYAGTSTGAIIAAGLACGKPPKLIMDMYKEHGEKIFSPKGSWYPKKVKPGLHSLYEKRYLSGILENVFKDLRLGEITSPLILPATDIVHGGVHVFKSNYSSSFTRDNDVRVRDAVLASCSAPTYFDPTKVGAYSLADGGLWANNPSLAAVIDAQYRLNKEICQLKVLSLGTGLSRSTYDADVESKNWGFVNGWEGKKFINFLMSVQAQSIQNYMQLMLSENQLLRVNFDSDMELTLDDSTQVPTLISRADRDFTHKSDLIKNFLSTGGINA
jgi:patatin-like phospholipase/acyl hydrolase